MTFGWHSFLLLVSSSSKSSLWEFYEDFIFKLLIFICIFKIKINNFNVESFEMIKKSKKVA